MKKINYSLIVSIILLATFALPVLAQVGGSGSTGTGGSGSTGTTNSSVGLKITLDNPFKAGTGDSLYSLMENLVKNVLMPIGGILCVLAFIYSGFLYVTAQGNSTKIKDANNALLYSAIGTAVLLGAWVIAKVINTTINSLMS